MKKWNRFLENLGQLGLALLLILLIFSSIHIFLTNIPHATTLWISEELEESIKFLGSYLAGITLDFLRKPEGFLVFILAVLSFFLRVFAPE